MSFGELDLAKPGSERSRKGTGNGVPLGIRLANGLAQTAILLLVVTVPWFFGGVYNWTQAACFPIVGLGLMLWLCLLPSRQSGSDVGPTLLLPLMAALLIPLAQAIPLDESWLARLSPTAAHWRNLPPRGAPAPAELPVDAVRPPSPPESNHAPVSLYPAATRLRAANLVLAVAIFALGARYFRRRGAMVAMAATLTCCGVAIAFFGVVQKISWKGLMYGSYPVLEHCNPFGPYFNRNNAAGFLNLTLAASLGLLWWTFGRRPQKAPSLEDVLDQVTPRASARRRYFDELLHVIATLSALQLAALFATCVIAAGVLASLSRGGILAMLAGLIVTCLATWRVKGNWLRMFALGLASSAAVGLLAFAGLARSLESRLTNMTSLSNQFGFDRAELWRVGMDAASDYWRSGCGLGAFRYVHQPYGTQFREVIYEYAENQYLETLAEAGIVGLALLILIIVLAGRVCFRLLRAARRHNEPYWIAVLALFALTTQMVQALFDFGLYVPSNYLALGLLLGAAAARAASTTQQSGPSSAWIVLPFHRWLVPASVVALLLAAVWGKREVQAAADVDQAMGTSRWSVDKDAISLDQVERQIETLATALETRPEDAEGQILQAQLWMRRYRLQALKQLTADVPDATASELWNATDLGLLHARAVEFAREAEVQQLALLRTEPTVTMNLNPAWRHLSAARRASPMLVESYLQMAMICFLAGSPLRDFEYLDSAVEIAPHDPRVSFVAGMLDLNADRVEVALPRLQAAWGADVGFAADIFRSASARLPFKTMFDRVFPQEPRILLRIADEFYRSEGHQQERRALANRAAELLAKPPADERDAGRRVLLAADAARIGGDPQRAIELYQQGLRMGPAEPQTLYRLIELLDSAGRNEEATRAVRAGLALYPNNESLKDWRGRLSKKSLEK